MDARFYNLKNQEINIENLANSLVNAYRSQGYQTQYVKDQDQVIVQFKKGGDFEAILGMQAALSLSLQRTDGGVMATAGQQKWIDKIAVGAAGLMLPILAPLAFTAGFGALRQAKLAHEAFSFLDGLVRQQYPDVHIDADAQGSSFF